MMERYLQPRGMRVYCLPGIGGDSRLFQNIVLPEGFDICCIDTVAPLTEEPIESYCRKILQSIDTSSPFILLGVSFGGILAVEMAKMVPYAPVISISSIVLSSELPPYFRISAAMGLHRLIHPDVLRLLTRCRQYRISAQEKEREIVRQLALEADNVFVQWAISAVLSWQSQTLPKRIFRIHGSRDHIFPLRYVRPDVIIGGGHLIVLYQAAQISALLSDLLLATRSQIDRNAGCSQHRFAEIGFWPRPS